MSGPGAGCTVLEPGESPARRACTLRSEEGLHLSFRSHVHEIKRSSELGGLGTLWGRDGRGAHLARSSRALALPRKTAAVGKGNAPRPAGKSCRSESRHSANVTPQPQRHKDLRGPGTPQISGAQGFGLSVLGALEQPEKTQAVGRNPAGWGHGPGEEGRRAGAGVGALRSLIRVGEFSELQ